MRNVEGPAETLSSILSAAGFLSRLPMYKLMPVMGIENPDNDFARTSRFFAPAGLIVALPAGILALVLSHTALSPFLIAALAIAALTASTGALHEDGLGDIADGLAGGATRERKLEIMRDSRIGTFAAVALILSVLIRVAALSAFLTADGGLRFLLAFLAIAAVSRGGIVWLWAYLPPAREAGLSRSQGMPSTGDAQFSLMLSIAIGLVFLLPLFGLARTLFILALGALALVAWGGICRRQIGGHTGDALGAAQQICEIALLLAGAIAI
jgi:adenosylcobinamide-GDP ribazoletransferase